MGKLYKDPNWMHENYIIHGLSSQDMAELAECCHITILRWLRKYDILVRGKYERTQRSRDKVSGSNHPRWAGDRVQRVCETCGVEYYIGPHEAKRGLRRFCSNDCQYNVPNWRGSKVQRICEICGVEFNVIPYRVKRGWGRFCSVACLGIWHSEECAGALHPMWRGGISFEPYSIDFNDRFKKSIRERDGHRCKLCNIPQNGRAHDVHHINYDKTNTRCDNCVALCVSCHMKTNTHRDYWQEKLMLLVQYGIERIPIT